MFHKLFGQENLPVAVADGVQREPFLDFPIGEIPVDVDFPGIGCLLAKEVAARRFVQAIVEVVDEVSPGLGSDDERAMLLQASLNNQAVHHSQAYNAAYHPHYRIVKREIFEKMLKNPQVAH